ncbi:MAG: pilin [bacterium]|nr:pilin [bacterium]
MIKQIPKIVLIFFMAVFVIQLVALLVYVAAPISAGAQVTFTPSVGIGNDFQAGQEQVVDNSTIAKYVRAIYQYGVGSVGIVATIVLMFGGIIWLTAGGSQERVSSAKEWIKASLTGLILVLLSYTILLTINPDLVNFQLRNINTVTKDIGIVESRELYIRRNIENDAQFILSRTEENGVPHRILNIRSVNKDDVVTQMKVLDDGSYTVANLNNNEWVVELTGSRNQLMNEINTNVLPANVSSNILNFLEQ